MSGTASEPCFLCKQMPNSLEKLHSDKDIMGDFVAFLIECPRCGRYQISRELAADCRERAADHQVSGVAREMSERGETLLLDAENIEGLRTLAPVRVVEKARRLLHAIARNSAFPGEPVIVNPELDYPLAYCRHSDELWFYLRHLSEMFWVDDQSDTGGSHCTVTPAGWSEVETDQQRNIKSDKAFVAMWFDSAMDTTYQEGIRPAIEDDVGYRSIRIDAVEHAGKIDDRIIAEIKESRFLIADFTGQRGGVYFEAGYAMGLGLPVIWTCREDEIGNVHFDTRQYNHIVWKEPGDLREKLALRIRAVVGTGSNVAREKRSQPS